MSVRNGTRYPEEWQHEKDLINPLLLVLKINGKGHKPNNMPETRKKQGGRLFPKTSKRNTLADTLILAHGN